MNLASEVADTPPERRDYYGILGLAPGAAGADVRVAYWRLARGYQLRSADEPQALDALDALNEAAEVLGTPALRRDYDALRIASAAATLPEKARRFSITLPGRSGTLARICACALLLVVAGLVSSPAPGAVHAYSAESIPGAAVTAAPIIFLGDSVTHGAGASSPDAGFAGVLQGRLEGAGVAQGPGDFDSVISALGGQAVDLRFSQSIGAQPRSLIVVEVGAHSVVEDPDLSPRDFATGYGLMLDCLQGTGAAIVVSTVPWLGWAQSDPFYPRAAERSAIIRLEAGSRGIPVADIWSAMEDRPELLSKDAFHPGDAGHQLIANLLWLQIAPLLNKPRGAYRARCDYDHLLASREQESARAAPGG
jgi:hypothetical protein